MSNEPVGLRPIEALGALGLTPNRPQEHTPAFEWVRPTELVVDGAYQRNLSPKSLGLIRRIVNNWDWRRFKPPIVARTEGGLEIIDGQHTAIAAASHPGVAQIPVMVVQAEERAHRADAFIGHNRDRVPITSMQLHAAAVAAGDEDALTVQQVCERAGVRLLRHPPAGGEFEPGDTVAVGAISKLIRRRGVIRAREILQALREADCTPVSAAAIKATELLLFDEEFAGQIERGEIAMTLRALGDIADREARLFAVAHRVPYWRALAVVIFRRRKRSGLRLRSGESREQA